MNKWVLIVGTFIVVVILGVFVRSQRTTSTSPSQSEITNFEECAATGNPIMESYPPRCSASGQTFTQDIGNELDYSDLIQITNPRPNQVITSPLAITGQARGYWFFEASFPVKLLDENGNMLAVAIATARDEWMTEEFVAFEAELEFDAPAGKNGTLILEKDNPSGLPQNADELRIPVKFKN